MASLLWDFKIPHAYSKSKYFRRGSCGEIESEPITPRIPRLSTFHRARRSGARDDHNQVCMSLSLIATLLTIYCN